MSFSKFINSCNSYSEFILKTSKLSNKGNWKKNKLAKDTAFEFLSKLIIEKHPIFKNLDIANVWHESEIPSREKKIIGYPEDIGDEGIDLLIKTKNNKYHVVQSKFRSNENDTLGIGKKSDLGTTFNLANNICKNIENIYILATINSVPKKIKLVPKNCFFILNNFFKDLDKEESGFKWNLLKSSFKIKDYKKELKKPENFQKLAVQKLQKHFKKNSRGCLFLPCGTGKTLISYWFVKKMNYRKILILVPNLTLVSQILNNWVTQNYAKNTKDDKWLVVCSDKYVRLSEDPLVINTKELPFDSTTDENKITNFFKQNYKNKTLIISTYNSSHKIAEISKKINFTFDICIFDEAHKTVGTKDKSFSKALYDEHLNVDKRLFMTATRRIIHGHEKIVDMRNEDIYGSVAYEMSFKEAIEGKNPRLCNYRFKAMGISKQKIIELWSSNPQVRSKKLDSTTMKYLCGLILLFNIWKKYNLKKGITFHNTIGGSENFKKIAEQYQKYLYPKNDVQFFNISSKKTLTGDKQSIISDFAKDKKSIITNARCLVEGVDVPAVDVILFSDKKRSRVDIVQAIGRCLRKSPGKEYGYVIVPFIFDKKQSKEKLLKSDYKDVIKTIRILSLYDRTFSEDIKFQAKTGKHFSGKVEIDLPLDEQLINIGEIKKAIRIENFRNIGPLNWLSFNDAKKYIQPKNISTSAQYYDEHKRGNFDADLPFDPQKIYEDEGWKNWGDFLGTGRIADQLKHERYLKYNEAKKIVHPLNIQSANKWRDFTETNKFKKLNLPKFPHSTYKIQGTWISWGDFLGTGRVSDNKKKYRSFNKARIFARSLKIKKRKNWDKLCKQGKIPSDIPFNPHNTYKNEFISYSDFFGNEAITLKVKFWSLSRSKKFIFPKKLKSLEEFQKWSAIPGQRPLGFPGNPNTVYKENVNWKGIIDFLGNHKKPYRKYTKKGN